MKMMNVSGAILGVFLLSVSGGTAFAYLPDGSLQPAESADAVGEAALILDMIQKGHVTIDPATGKLTLNNSILSILQEYGFVSRTMIPKHAGPSCQKSQRCD